MILSASNVVWATRLDQWGNKAIFTFVLLLSDCGRASMGKPLLKFDHTCFNHTGHSYMTTGDSYASDNVWVIKLGM